MSVALGVMFASCFAGAGVQLRAQLDPCPEELVSRPPPAECLRVPVAREVLCGVDLNLLHGVLKSLSIPRQEYGLESGPEAGTVVVLRSAAHQYALNRESFYFPWVL